VSRDYLVTIIFQEHTKFHVN